MKFRSGGIFVVSIDFELAWGIIEKRWREHYKSNNILAVREVVPRLLDVFKRYDIHVTWATVGFIMLGSRSELLSSFPRVLPQYQNNSISPYEYIDQGNVGLDEGSDPYHYGQALVKLIRQAAHQEIATHTFSHYYCLEGGQTSESFRADMEAALQLANSQDVSIKSIIFPRNQVKSECLEICGELGIRAYRGNQRSWMYDVTGGGRVPLVKRMVRLMDSYVNLSGRQYSSITLTKNQVVNVPASRYLRPYHKRLRILEPLRLNRILDEMTSAAQHGRCYHLWWHPHDFGSHTEENIKFLERILQHYQSLNTSYGMVSRNMMEAAAQGNPGT